MSFSQFFSKDNHSLAFQGIIIFIFIFGWPQAASYAAETDNANKISKEEVKTKFDASQLSGKYEMRGASFHKTVKADKAEKTEVRIGNILKNIRLRI